MSIVAAADYLTTTWPRPEVGGFTVRGEDIADWTRKIARVYRVDWWLKPWSWQGYRGYCAGPVSYGEREDGMILRLSGVSAHHWIYDGLPTGHNVSRLDIAITVWGCDDIDGTIARHNQEAVAYRSTLHSRPFVVSHINGNGGGDTLYIGSRTSARYVRIYNKWKESGEDEQFREAIRYEVEYKDEAARAALDAIGAGRYRTMAPIQYALGFLEGRGIRPYGCDSLERASVGPVSRVTSDTEKRLAWLRSQVAPTVRELLRLGLYDDTLDALGIGRT